MANFNNLWADTGTRTEPTGAEIEAGHDTVELPKHDWENWYKHLVAMALQSLERTGAMPWDSAVPYQVNARVMHSGVMYYAIAANTNKPPNANPGEWASVSASAVIYDDRYGRFSTDDTLITVQATAPTGWVVDTSHNNRSLKIVNSGGGITGGTVDYSSVFTSARASNSAGSHSHSITVNNKTLTTSMMPSHKHEIRNSASEGSASTVLYYADRGGSANQTSSYTMNEGGGGAHNHGASSASAGSHSHTTNLDVKYTNGMVIKKAA